MEKDTKNWKDLSELEKRKEQDEHRSKPELGPNRKQRRQLAAKKRRANRKARKEGV